MEQLLLHLIGDYVTQSDKIAQEKTRNIVPAVHHGLLYSLPFLLITNATAWVVIFVTHVLIDRYRLARYVIFAKNWVYDRNLKWSDCEATGFHKDRPVWLAVWLLIIVDNAMHLTINFLAINYL